MDAVIGREIKLPFQHGRPQDRLNPKHPVAVAMARKSTEPRQHQILARSSTATHLGCAHPFAESALSSVPNMACMGRTMSRSFLSTTRSAFRACKTTTTEAAASSMKGRSPCATPAAPSPSPSSFFQTRRPASYIFRLPGEVACMQSLLPLHSATASSRLVAQLSTTAGALFQGGVWLIDDN